MNKEVNLAEYYFHQGTNFESYRYLGCNSKLQDGIYRYFFRVWAPSAVSVELISDFTGWECGLSLYRATENGIFEVEYDSPVTLEKKAYKFRITTKDGRKINKGDPYAKFSRGVDDGASLIYTHSRFVWNDDKWLKHRKKTVTSKNGAYIPTAVNIYELHLESFKRKADGSLLSYREIADELAPYVKAMGYTHVELLPIMEYPYNGSWGYQVCGFYAPSSRFGDPDDFRYLVNKLHTMGVGIILDWVPAHFPKDEWGLYEFDGSPLYEYQGRDRQESRSWGTRFFDLGREEVQCFLISNALYYFREFHVDGLRVDAVASMLYLDYDRDAGEWIPNVYGENLNLEAIAFFKKLNTAVFSEFSSVFMIAEESTAFGNITKPVSDGGLGFNMKWNMGFANDFYKYLSASPSERTSLHTALNFPIMYAFSENYCLPISHDEVVHGKKSFIDKMHGDIEDKFSQMRTALLLFMSYPGKKLMFMGTEFAQFREWNYEDSLEWFMLDYDNHSAMQNYVRALNCFYLSSKELWELDFSPNGFEWILADENEKCSVAYRRKAINESSLIFVLNFSDRDQNIRLKVAPSITLDQIFATDSSLYEKDYTVFECEGEYFCEFCVKRYSGVVLKENDKILKIKEKRHVL